MDTSFETTTNSVEWYTPPHIVAALGPFTMDPCAPTIPDTWVGRNGKKERYWLPKHSPWNYGQTCYTEEEDGLSKEWKGRVWMNPPYGREMAAWMKKLSQHGNGIALIFARTETQAFFNHVWGKASAIFFLKGRLKFHQLPENPDQHLTTIPSKNPAGAPSVLISYDNQDNWLNANALKNCGLPGYFVDLTPSEVMWAGWKFAIRSILEFGPLTLQDLYVWVDKCIDRPENKHIQAKIRQTLNRYDELFEQSEGKWKLKESL